MACIGTLPAPKCMKGIIAAQTKCFFGTILQGNDQPSAMVNVVGEQERFIVAFCGSGTGHLTQAMRVVEMLEERGQMLAGIVTDTDAAEKMLDEMFRPLCKDGVELLIIPAIELVDTETGFLPLVNPSRFVGSFMNAQKSLFDKRAEYAAFFARARAGRIYSMYHSTLARFFQLNPLPPSVKIVHMAAQFGLCDLPEEATVSFVEVGTKAVMDLLKDIFISSGEVAVITPLGTPGSLPPIIHSPAPLDPTVPKLVLCYFLVRTSAEILDRILADNPMPGVEFHCFPSKPLERPVSQLHSHQKQRKLFQELFSKCTAVIVSAGNETVWEAVCRGVPVLTIPTEGHGEQLLNAAVHARNFPNLVRSAPLLSAPDVRWLVDYDLEAAGSVAESASLRKLVDEFNKGGSPLLEMGDRDNSPGNFRDTIKRRVSSALDSAKNWVDKR